ncbi:MAG: hypothetical protein H6737_30010 [Alphaproteobacteria bacterium]|nr:hypothetical protein [Alphaproteobacteria bacterium]
MERTRRSSQSLEQPKTRTASLDAPTNNEKASNWGNGLSAESVHAPSGSGSGSGMANSFLGISQDLSGSTSQFGQPGERTWSDWTAGGFGAAYGGEFGAGPYERTLGGGIGAGGGFGQWSEVNGKRTSNGFGGGAAVAGRFDESTSLWGQSLGMGGDVYRGVGGSAYEFSEGNKSGYGITGGYTPLGFNDAYASVNTGLGSNRTSVGQAEIGRVGGNLEGYTTDKGGWGLNGGWSQGRNTFRDINSTTTTGLGTTDISVGQVSQGKYMQGKAGRDDDGRYFVGGKKGGSLSVNDVDLNHTWGNGMQTTAHLGSYGGNGKEFEAGFNPNTMTADFQGVYGSGKKIKDVSVGTDLPGGGNFNASLGQFQNGSQVRIDRSTIGPDGAHIRGGGHMSDGFELQNAKVGGGWDGVYTTEASLGRFSNRTQIDGASLDIDGNGIRAGVQQVRTGGFVAQNMHAEQNFGDGALKTNANVGEVSNDILLNGGRASIDGSGVHAGFDELDFGGVRVKDVNYNASVMNGAAELDARMGSFTNGNNIKGGNVDITRNGVNASVEEFGIMGTDVNDVHVGVKGPGGTHANADLGAYHTGISGKNAYAEINGSGVNVGAEHLDYNQHQLKDVNLEGGIDGIYNTHARLGEGHLNQASADNVNLSLNGDGLSGSADNLNYSYLGVEDFSAGQSFGDGAVETELSLGKGDYLGAGADHVEFQSNLIDSSGSVDGLNAHGLNLQDLNAHVGVGDAGLDVGAKELDVLDLNVGHADFHRENFGLSGGGNIQDAQLDVLDAKGLGGGLSWGDDKIAEARTDLNLSAGVDQASGEWDVLSGTANGQFTNANASLMTDNTHLEAFGHSLDLGRTGASINASGAGAVDLSKGQASGNVNFAGSELALFGNSVTVGDWAQASGSVDASKGQANFNVGGENGVGADVDIGAGNLDINAFGHKIDVDEGIRDGVSAVKDGAAWVGDKASSAANWAGDRLSDAGSAISSGASKAWDVVTSW